jgi:GTP-binding protein LepA
MRLTEIRNFCIIAHVDHGKSTLADRLLLATGAISSREFRAQILDDMDLERERGITIKARAVRMEYERDGQTYHLNLIDTPGHVDFSYEVSRSLAACEGALLLVDASQGIQAQTVANLYQAAEAGLTVVPVISKVDLPTAMPEVTSEEIAHVLGGDPGEVILTSAKTGEGVNEMLDAIVDRVPPPEGDPDGPVRALIFDSVFDDYRGVIAYVRMLDGRLRVGDEMLTLKTREHHDVTEVGHFRPRMEAAQELRAGEVGYIISGVKDLTSVRIGDTITTGRRSQVKALPGYEEPRPMVYCGLYPTEETETSRVREALEKLSLNDSSFTFEPEVSPALGYGFRCGFLGLLHMDVVQERLEREGDLSVIQTAPTVTYELKTRDGEVSRIQNPADLPDPQEIDEFREPVVRIELIVPADGLGTVMRLCEDRRGTYVRTEYLSPQKVELVYDLPLGEIVFDFYDKLKSVTHGYGSMDYELLGYRPADLVRLDILVAGDRVDALSMIVHRSQAEQRGRRLASKLKEHIQRHLFAVAIQAAVGSRIIARETVRALSKHVTGKCYGGDITRKRKLWEKQKEGKKRLKQIGKVRIPQEAFLAVLTSE